MRSEGLRFRVERSFWAWVGRGPGGWTRWGGALGRGAGDGRDTYDVPQLLPCVGLEAGVALGEVLLVGLGEGEGDGFAIGGGSGHDQSWCSLILDYHPMVVLIRE